MRTMRKKLLRNYLGKRETRYLGGFWPDGSGTLSVCQRIIIPIPSGFEPLARAAMPRAASRGVKEKRGGPARHFCHNYVHLTPTLPG
jgi:hypothetical protein